MHYLDPSKERAHVLVVYRNFLAAGTTPYCHIGLGVNALHTAKCLRRHKVRCDIAGVWRPEDVEKALSAHPTVTHCIIEAPWISAERLTLILYRFPNVQIIVRAHSQIGFLQVEAGAIRIIRDMLLLQESVLNLTVAANSLKLTNFLTKTYLGKVLYLPNLYDLERTHARPAIPHHHRTLRIGSFGALRLLKNHTTAAAAALLLAEKYRADLEFWISVNREEHGKGVLQSLRNMFSGLHWAKLVENGWESWPAFRRTIGLMDLCLQVSMTETFNITSADAVAEGVPVVTGSAIEWVPPHWKADIDSPEAIARVGAHLIHDPHAVEEGQKALQTFCKESEASWLHYLSSYNVA